MRKQLRDFRQRQAQALERKNLVQPRDFLGAVRAPARLRAHRRQQSARLVQPERLLADAEASRRFGRTEMTLSLRH